MKALTAVLYVISAVTMAHGLYFLIVSFQAFKKKQIIPSTGKDHRFCSVIAARNEERVIGDLIRDLKGQNYPEELHDIYVVINNCTDRTEQIVSSCGASVFRCADPVRSKGEALRQFFDSGICCRYDAFCIFDADNLVDKDFIREMNRALNSGISIAQGMRDIKNPADSPAASCSALYFWVLNRFLNDAHDKAGFSAYLLGTGCMFQRSILERIGFFTTTMTEDLEFSVQNILQGERIAMVSRARVYDEQPVRWADSANQRKRWSTGMIECGKTYVKQLFECCFGQKKKCAADAIMYLLFPVMQLFAAFQFLLSLLLTFVPVCDAAAFFRETAILFLTVMCFSWILTFFHLAVTGHRMREIHPLTGCFVWFYLFSWMVINVVCLVHPVKDWAPIPHSVKREGKE